MTFVLCLGDLHIPHRSIDLPEKFKELLKPEKINMIISPGNLCAREVVDYLRSICTDLKITRGDFDEDLSFPEHLVCTVGDLRVGVCHGHQTIPSGDLDALAILVRQLDVDILVTGNTHCYRAAHYEDALIVDPGSATGAYSMYTHDVVPSFALLHIDGPRAMVYHYSYVDDDLKVEKLEYVKPQPGADRDRVEPVREGNDS